ncbi:MAG: S8 family serine peptidase [Gammaproteobacteria bacterium]|nr:S8 family serine peptidase [Gammaproteobacteria bacterium]
MVERPGSSRASLLAPIDRWPELRRHHSSCGPAVPKSGATQWLGKAMDWLGHRHLFGPAASARAALLTLLLAGCGGGGGSSGAAAPVANIPPTASFTADPISGGSPLTVSFDGSSSNDPDGSIASYSWNFGDGSPLSTAAVVDHTYTDNTGNGATYTARLTVTDSRNATGIKDALIRVGPAGGNFVLSGSVLILPSSAIDSDVNDTNTAAVTNNDFDQAQVITNPVSLGGYLTRPGAGEDGNLQVAGDVADFYQVSLAGNETIVLTVGEPAPESPADDPTLSLQIYDATRTLRDAVPAITESAVMPAPGAGTFFIEVAITGGATNYVLNLGQNVPASAGIAAPRLSEAFVPGEIVVVASPAAHLPADFDVIADDGELRLLGLGHGARNHRDSQRLTGPRVGARLAADDLDKYDTLVAAARLRRVSGVRHAEPNYLRQPHRTPNDVFYRYQWHYPSINLPLAWDITLGSPDVIVAVVDTGILPNHPDLIGQLVPGYDFISDPSVARDGNGIDADPTDTGNPSGITASTFHGSHVAGTIAARSDNNEGVAGVAWNVKLMPLRALGQESGTNFDVMQALRFAAGLSNNSGSVPAQRADVINMSLGSPGASAAEQSLLDQIRQLGIIVVASAGNEASSAPSYPAAYNGVVSVAATTINKVRASYSSFGATIDVAAPGGFVGSDFNGDGLADGVLSTVADDEAFTLNYNYRTLMGTSMAAPHIAGVVALMKSVHPGLTPQQFDDLLAQSLITEDLGAPGRDDQFGWGLIDAQRAVIEALDLANSGGAPTGPILIGAPGSVNFGVFDTTADIIVRNAGSGALNITGVTSTAPWLTVTPLTIDANGLGTYQLSVNRAAATGNGAFSAQARFASDIPGGAPFVVSVVMQKFAVNPVADAGRHYVVVFHPPTGTTVAGSIAQLSGGIYTYSIPNVGSGTYQIYAGTDSDNDDFLCDGGEACGAFRLLEFPESITVTGSRSGLDFVSGFPVNLFDLANQSATHAHSAPATSGIALPAELASP